MFRSSDYYMDARLTQLSQMRKCSRSPLHRTATFPLRQLQTFSELSALKMFGSVGPIRLFAVNRQLEGEVETAAKHSEIIFRTIDHAET
jgi:hypothetical protein